MKRHVASLLIGAGLTAAPLLASAQSWDSGRHEFAWRNGVIARVENGAFTLRDGMRVDLSPGIRILPNGTMLRPGMLVAVQGWTGRGGTFHATRLHVERNRIGYVNGYNANPGARYYGDGWYDRDGSWHRYG